MQGLSWNLSKSAKPYINSAIYVFGLIPALWYFYLGSSNQLGADPVKSFEQALGLWALRFLIFTLALLPIRDMLGWNFLRYRRAFGLLSFYYALLHLTVYLLLDQAMEFAALLDDVMKRPFITFGMAAFALLVPLALTSNNFSIRKMGKKWVWLHRSVYIVAMLVLLHFSLSAKVLSPDHYFYITLLILLLLYRVRRVFRRKQPKLKRV